VSRAVWGETESPPASKGGRVDRGGNPPRPLTDPDMRDYRIRLLRITVSPVEVAVRPVEYEVAAVGGVATAG